MPLEANGRVDFSIDNITTYFSDDLALKNAKGDSLRKFVKDNPYSGVLQLLYCKYLHLNNDAQFENQLEKCSLVVADRKKVYELLFQPIVQEKIREYEKDFVEEENPVEVEQSEVLLVPQIQEENDLINSDIEEDLKVKTETKTEGAKSVRKTIDELEENILVEAVNSSIQLDISKYAENSEDDIIEVEKGKENISIEKEPESNKRIFVSWFEKPKVKLKKKKEESRQSIVDDFLKTTARSRKKEVNKKEAIFSPTNIAKMSLVANNEFVTETLANIYAKQGQIDKAIEIYKQLSLKNPEKKTFFASRIRFLKEKQKYNN